MYNFISTHETIGSKELKELSYKQFVLLILEYASSVWNPCHLYNINKIETIQHRAARFVLGCPWRRDLRDSITSMVSSLGWPSLQLRRKCARLALLFNLVRNFLVISPEYLPVPLHVVGKSVRRILCPGDTLS